MNLAEQPKSRNPAWHRDEIILVLNHYMSKDRGPDDKKNPKIIALSEILNALPLFTTRPDAIRFRNPNGVATKIANFKAIDPNYQGKGLSSYSKQDEVVFHEFRTKPEQLKFLAEQIKYIALNSEIKSKIIKIEEDENTLKDQVIEGQIIYKLHKLRERDPKIVEYKKREVLNKYGKLACEACVFEFEPFYGDIGKGYIECHHRIPLYKFNISKVTTLDDLALVCSNCHRMLHKGINTLSIEDLAMKIRC